MKKGIRGLLLLLLVAISAQAADTLWVKVTYYDFHSDRSNPEFEQPYDGKDKFLTDMVADTLDSDGKPVLGSKPFRNNYIKYWYRDWSKSGGGKGDYKIPKYIYGDFDKNVLLTQTPNFKWFSTIPDNNAITALQSHNGKYATWPKEKHYLTYNIPGTTRGELDYFAEWFADIIADGDTTLQHDTSFKNVVVKDSIPFIDENGNGHYVFENDNFYPLDGKGFGTEWNVHDAPYIQDNNKWTVPVSYLTQPDGDYNNINNGFNNLSFTKVTVDGKIYFIDKDFGDTLGLQMDAKALEHNYAFTMEMDYEFVMKSGLQFKFSGDDDLWVFIDGKKVLDLGGIHSPATDSFSVDDINTSLNLNLESGKRYSLKAFYAERHSDSSHILITTNIVPVPGEVSIDLNPKNALIKAGEDELIASLSIKDSDGNPISNDNITSVIWDWDNSTPNNSFFNKVGSTGKEDTLKFTKPHDAYDTITVKVSVLYKDPLAGGAVIPKPVEDEVKIIVIPGSYHHLSLEETGAMPTDINELRDDNPIDTVKILPGMSGVSVYAIQRDQFGNWIGPATGMSDDDWTSDDENIIVGESGNSDDGEGVAVKVGVGGTTELTGTYDGKDDEVVVVLSGIELAIESAIYIDNNKDGYVDEISVEMNDYTKKVFEDSSNINMSIVLNKIFQYLELTSDKKLDPVSANPKSDDGGFIITVDADKSNPPFTGVNETDYLVQTESVQDISNFAAVNKDSIKIDDGLAPVIIKVIYDPNDEDFDGKKKTLLVEFSETIKKPNVNDLSNELQFFDKVNGTPYSMILKEMDEVDNPDEGTTFEYEVVQIEDNDNPETGDEVNLKGGDVIEDLNDNVVGKETEQIEIDVKPYKNTVVVGVIGPFIPNDKIENIDVIKDSLNISDDSEIGDEGTLLIVKIDGVVLDADSSSWTIDVRIYDAVGNTVQDNIPAVFTKNNSGKSFIVANWDGKNSGGRAVGSGSYLAQIIVNNKAGALLEERIIIAVKGVNK